MNSKLAFNLPNSKLLLLDLNNIVYFEKDGKSINICLNDNTKEDYLNMSMKGLSDLLKEKELYGVLFLKPHCSYIVNINYIKIVNTRSILMTNGTEIPISNNKRIDFKNKIKENLSIIF